MLCVHFFFIFQKPISYVALGSLIHHTVAIYDLDERPQILDHIEPDKHILD